ncbi:MAG: hypothetical protein JNL11_19275 [Bdellovibrionaceae bacterium]|nr:hypothetical protein [Pseudobdellovibrionaceae bacterium]
MRSLLLFIIIYVTACASNPSKPDEAPTPKTCTSPSKDGWPVHPGHFYDKEIHLVPSFSKAPSNYKAPNFMTGYSVVFIKPESNYSKMGLNFGDEIVAIDEDTFDDKMNPQEPPLAILRKIKNHEFKKIQIHRCLEIR